jgi:hypothetical protein
VAHLRPEKGFGREPGSYNVEILPAPIRTAGRVTAWVLFAAIVLAAVLAAWVAIRGALAYQDLARIQNSATDLSSSLVSDPASAIDTLDRLAADAESARNLTDDPVWRIAEHLPWMGPQLAALSTVAASTDELLSKSLVPLAHAAQDASVESFKPVGGRVETTTFTSIVAPAKMAAAHASDAAARVRDIDPTPLLGVVDSAVGRAGDLFAEVASAVDGLSRASQLLPSMLGMDGPRSYLLLVQNNAELRSLGGITGTVILLRADHGAVSLVQTDTATGLSAGITEPQVELPTSLTDIFGTKPARYFHNLTQIPDFTIDGPLAQTMFQKRTGIRVDGVLSMDPVALSYLLRATGPVRLSTGDTLDAASAAPFLLNGVYLKYPDPVAQDAVFAAAAGEIFQGLLDGRGAASGLIEGLTQAGRERRIFMWSANATEQAVIAGTTIAGSLTSADSNGAALGVFLNDATGSKMSYYVRPDVSLAWDSCPASRTTDERELSLEVTLTSDAPADAATTLPWYITGGGVYGVAPGNASTVAYIFLPDGFELVEATATDGGGYAEHPYEGREVLTFGTNLKPGESTTLSIHMRGATGQDRAEAFVTPTANASINPAIVAFCDR